MKTDKVLERMGELVGLIYEDLNKLQTFSVRSRNTQMKLVGLFQEVSEVVQNLDFPDDDTAGNVVDLYVKIAEEHEFSGETFEEISKTILTFMSYMNIMFGYIAAGKDLKQNESTNKRRRRQHRKRYGKLAR